MGWLKERFEDFHESSKTWDPITHQHLEDLNKYSSKSVQETSRGFSKTFGDTWLGNLGQHWVDMGNKDEEDFSRWLTNTAMSAAAIYGGMSGYEYLGSGAGGSGAGFGSGGSAGAGSGAGTGGGMGWGDWISGGGNLLGGFMQSKGVSDAAEATADAANRATDEQRRQYDTTRADYAPWRMSGARALMQLDQDISGLPTAEEVMADPGYQFGMDEGQRALDRKIAAMGGRVSGRALKAATRYGGDYASTRYGAAYQRGQDRLNRLAAVAGLGQTATAGSAAAGMNSANALSSIAMQQGENNAGASMAQGNIWANTGNQLAALYGRNQQPRQPSQPTYDEPWSLSNTNRGSGD